jgi:hypothetical protein
MNMIQLVMYKLSVKLLYKAPTTKEWKPAQRLSILEASCFDLGSGLTNEARLP